MTRHTVTAHDEKGSPTCKVECNSVTEAFQTEDAMLDAGYANITIE